MDRSLLRRNRDYRRLAASSAISGIGDWMFGLALAVWVLERTHSAGWVAATVGTRMAPYAFFSAFGGAIADRFERRRVLVTFDVTRAVLVGLLVGVVAFHGPVVAGILLATLIAVATTPYRPAVVAIVPSVVPPDDLTAANAIEAGICQTLMFAGPATAGLLLRVLSPAAVFAIDAATFVVSALLVAGLPRMPRPSVRSVDSTRWRDDIRAGGRAARVIPGVPAYLALIGIVTLGFGAMMVTHLVFVQQRLGEAPSSAGFLAGAGAVGGIAATGIARRFGDVGSPARVLAGCALLMGGSMLALSVVGSLGLACLAVLPEGIGSVVLEIVGVATLQRVVPSELLGRVYGVQDTISGAGQMSGALIAPLLIACFGPAGCIAAVGIPIVAAGLALMPSMRDLGQASTAPAFLPVAIVTLA